MLPSGIICWAGGLMKYVWVTCFLNGYMLIMEAGLLWLQEVCVGDMLPEWLHLGSWLTLAYDICFLGEAWHDMDLNITEFKLAGCFPARSFFLKNTHTLYQIGLLLPCKILLLLLFCFHTLYQIGLLLPC